MPYNSPFPREPPFPHIPAIRFPAKPRVPCPVKRVSPSTLQEFSVPAATRRLALTQAASPFQPAFSRENRLFRTSRNTSHSRTRRVRLFLPRQTSFSLNSARIFRSRRDTPTCVNPSNFAVSVCVFPREPPFPQTPRSVPRQTSFSLSSARIFLSRRDTPTCVNPSSFAVSACVFPREPPFPQNPAFPAPSNEFLPQFRKNFSLPPRHADLR